LESTLVGLYKQRGTVFGHIGWRVGANMQGREEQRNHEQGTPPESGCSAVLAYPVAQQSGVRRVKLAFGSISDRSRHFLVSHEDHSLGLSASPNQRRSSSGRTGAASARHNRRIAVIATKGAPMGIKQRIAMTFKNPCTSFLPNCQGQVFYQTHAQAAPI